MLESDDLFNLVNPITNSELEIRLKCGEFLVIGIPPLKHGPRPYAFIGTWTFVANAESPAPVVSYISIYLLGLLK